jgi:hypothetical protein
MESDPYVELHLHTSYSFLDGASQPEELVLRAKELGYRALAVTDHDGLYGAMEFAQAANQHDIQPITGAELTLTDGSHLTLLVRTEQGYANLCELITAAHHFGLEGGGEAGRREGGKARSDGDLWAEGDGPHPNPSPNFREGLVRRRSTVPRLALKLLPLSPKVGGKGVGGIGGQSLPPSAFRLPPSALSSALPL